MPLGYGEFTSVSDKQRKIRTASILTALQQASVTEIRFRFSGGHDESFVDGFDPKENVDLRKIKLIVPDDQGQGTETNLLAAVEEELSDWLGEGDYDFRCGYGTGTWTMADGRIRSEYHDSSDDGLDEYENENSD